MVKLSHTAGVQSYVLLVSWLVQNFDQKLKDKIIPLHWYENLHKNNEILVRQYFPSINFVKDCMGKYLQNWWHTATTDILVTVTDFSET